MNIITLHAAVARNPQARLNAPADFLLSQQEHIAIMGPNGAGKTRLVGMLTGKVPLVEGTLAYDFGPGTEPRAWGNIVQLTFEDALGSVETPYYFQQRFNSQDREESPYVWQVMGMERVRTEARAVDGQTSIAGTAVDVRSERDIERSHMVPLSDEALALAREFRVDELLEKRRLHLFRNLLGNPKVLILDNPFIGLDAPMRDQLTQFLARIAASGKVNLVLVQSMLDSVPDFITHVVGVEDGVVATKQTRDEYLRSFAARPRPTLFCAQASREICDLPVRPVASLAVDGQPTDDVVEIRNLSLSLGEGRTLYGGLSWTVKRGERWALQGRNGACKSTLLSLICADHPAAYACDISLFGRRRGTGESIWDVKRHIGFVSPEFHRAYRENRPAIEIVASGLHDSVGLYRRPRPEQIDICRLWMRVFGIEGLADRQFLTLSSGEQRLCLLARAFVKDPALLILDEPLHGLDTWRRQLVRDVIAAFCRRPDKTLIMVSHYAEELPDIIDHSLTL